MHLAKDIEEPKQDIGKKKQDIVILDLVGNRLKEHISNLFEEFGYDRFFGRTEAMQLLSKTRMNYYEN